jgi:N-methylhydantoinase A/oxoprolinase/acetone carboxylase beta subunit
MFIGADIGGTNTDVAVVDDGVTAIKVPNSMGFTSALEQVTAKGRLAVSTSQPLNRLLTRPDFGVYTLLVPGPGLYYEHSLMGSINHRGDIVEDLDPEEILRTIKENRTDAIAIATKFSIRNPRVEEEIGNIAAYYYPEERIALSHHIGQLNFPARIATTQVNAKIRETVCSITRTIKGYAGDFLFMKGDGGLSPPPVVTRNPSLILQSSPAAVSIGAYYLSRRDDCLVVDIGGTTTDLVQLRGGRPVLKSYCIEGRHTLIRGVDTISIPLGGDSLIREGLLPIRMGSALAFGGPEPALTDALNRTGYEIGNPRLSAPLAKKAAQEAIAYYTHRIAAAVISLKPCHIIGTGFLAPYLIPEIAKKTGIPYEIPEFAACANAIGVAVSRISLSLEIHIDSGRKKAMVNGRALPYTRGIEDDDITAFCIEEARSQALRAGAPEEDVQEIELVNFHAYDVIRLGRQREKIADVVVQIEPGITVEAL